MKKTVYTATITLYLVALFAFSTLFIACEGMTDNYQQYLEGGEIVYPGKPDSIKCFPGKNRTKLQWLILSDPSITHFTVYWNNKSKSETLDIDRIPGPQEVELIVENLEEGAYTFEVFSFDRYLNRSVGQEIVGSIYGNDYRSKLLNRSIESIVFDKNNIPTIVWGPQNEEMIAEEVQYIDNQGQKRLVSTAAGEEKTVLTAYDSQVQDGFVLTTVFMPEENAIDTFHCVPEWIPAIK